MGVDEITRPSGLQDAWFWVKLTQKDPKKGSRSSLALCGQLESLIFLFFLGQE